MGDKRLRRLICVPLLAVCLAAAAFAATGAFGASGRHATPTAVRAGAAGLARVGVVERGGATSPPAALRGSVPSRFRLDLSRAREVRPATDPGSWYVVPGPDDLCFFDGNGWACNSIANAQAGYLFTVLIPRAA